MVSSALRRWPVLAGWMAVWLLGSLAAAAIVPARAASAPVAPTGFEAFFGTYKGQTILEGDGVVTTRDLDVAIAPTDRGFNVSWTTTTLGRDGATKRDGYSIDFEQTRRPGIFASQMRTNMFGNRVPLDPLRGDPFVWARIADTTLTVYALLITDNGSYEMQTYHRTLQDGGLALRFFRFREGETVRTVTASLRRIKP